MRVPKRKPKPTIYQSEIDPAQIVWSNRTHRTVSEAFRDADYACALWRCENDWDITKEYIKWSVIWAFTLGFLYVLSTWFNEVVR